MKLLKILRTAQFVSRAAIEMAGVLLMVAVLVTYYATHGPLPVKMAVVGQGVVPLAWVAFTASGADFLFFVAERVVVRRHRLLRARRVEVRS